MMVKLTALNVYQDFKTKMTSSCRSRRWRRFLNTPFLLYNRKTLAATRLRELCKLLSLTGFPLVREGGIYLSTLSQEDAHCRKAPGLVIMLFCKLVVLLSALSSLISKNTPLSSLEHLNLNTQVGSCIIQFPSVVMKQQCLTRCQ